MLIHAQPLSKFIETILVSSGADETSARRVADHLVLANLKGHDSHGVGMVPSYVRNIRTGMLNVNGRLEILEDNGAILVVDGQFGFGQVIGIDAMDVALDRVTTTGVVCLALRNAHHLGRIGTFGEYCAERGMVSIHFVNAVGHFPLVAPWGGLERRLQTNPICCAVPNDVGRPFVLDMATSEIAAGKVRVAYNSGNSVPKGSLLDHDGNETSDPNVFYHEPRGSLSPFGKHKGYGLSVVCELLAGALVGNWTGQSGPGPVATSVNHMLTFVLDPNTISEREKFQSELRQELEYLRSTKPSQDNDKVRIAGDPEFESMQQRSLTGIEIDDKTWNELLATAESVELNTAAIPKDERD